MTHHIKEDKRLAAKLEIEEIYKELASRISDGDWYYTPRLIKKLVDLEQAKICRELPAPADVIAQKLNLDTEKVKKEIKELVRRGVLVPTKDSAKFPAVIGAFIDFASTTPYNDERLDDEFYEMLAARCEEPDWVEGTANLFATGQLGGVPMNRVVPKWRSIKDIPGVMPCEDIREILKPADGKLSTSRCMCKQIWPRRIPAMFEGTHPDEGHCIHFGSMADHYVKEMGVGKYLSWEEAMALMDGLDAAPVAHIVVNAKDVHWICQCDDQSCVLIGTMRRSRKFDIKDGIAPSRFLAQVETKRCAGHGVCLTKCPFSAIRLKEGKAHIIAEKCMGCGTCVLNCPEKAIKMKLIRPADFIPEHGFQWVETFYLQPSEPAYT